MTNLDPDAWGGGDRPYRQLYPPQPVTRRHVVSSKDDTFINSATGTVVRVPVEDRTPQKITRVTTFGTEVIDLSNAREDQDR